MSCSVAVVVLATIGMLALAELLSTTQHAALMTVYDAIGCSTAVCTRFAASADCPQTPSSALSTASIALQCATGIVTTLYVADSNLTGTFPTQIGLLSGLQSLRLTNNLMVGTIPTEIGRLTKLRLFYMYNSFQKQMIDLTIPSELGRLTELSSMRWNSMRLTGSIPTQIGNMVGLSTLVLAYNNLVGTIPSGLTRLTSLGKLNLRNNAFTGVFPSLSQVLSECIIQVAGDTNCLQCGSAVAANCTCDAATCMPSQPQETGSPTPKPTLAPTPKPTTSPAQSKVGTTTTATTTETSTSTSTLTMEDSSTPMPTTTTTTTTAATTSTSSITTFPTTRNLSFIGPPTPLQSTDDEDNADNSPFWDGPLIGGIVVGGFCCLLLAALLIFAALRRCRNGSQRENSDSIDIGLSGYGNGTTQAGNTVGRGEYAVVRLAPTATYDSPAIESSNYNSSTPSPNYDYSRVVKETIYS